MFFVCSSISRFPSFTVPINSSIFTGNEFSCCSNTPVKSLRVLICLVGFFPIVLTLIELPVTSSTIYLVLVESSTLSPLTISLVIGTYFSICLIANPLLSMYLSRLFSPTFIVPTLVVSKYFAIVLIFSINSSLLSLSLAKKSLKFCGNMSSSLLISLNGLPTTFPNMLSFDLVTILCTAWFIGKLSSNPLINFALKLVLFVDIISISFTFLFSTIFSTSTSSFVMLYISSLSSFSLSNLTNSIASFIAVDWATSLPVFLLTLFGASTLTPLTSKTGTPYSFSSSVVTVPIVSFVGLLVYSSSIAFTSFSKSFIVFASCLCFWFISLTIFVNLLNCLSICLSILSIWLTMPLISFELSPWTLLALSSIAFSNLLIRPLILDLSFFNSFICLV